MYICTVLSHRWVECCSMFLGDGCCISSGQVWSHESTGFKFSLDVKYLFIILLNFIITGQFWISCHDLHQRQFYERTISIFCETQCVHSFSSKKKGGGGGGVLCFFICFRTTVVNKWIDTVVSGLEGVSGYTAYPPKCGSKLKTPTDMWYKVQLWQCHSCWAKPDGNML